MTQIDEISQTVSTIPPLMLTSEVVSIPEDEVAFVNAYETNNEHLVNNTVPELNALKTQFNTSVGQINTVAQEIQDIGTNAINAISLDTIEDLTTYTGTGLVMVKEIDRGGNFISKTAIEIDPKTGSLYVINNGTVFSKLGGGFWVRQYNTSYVNALWFGADKTGILESTDAIQSAINYANTIVPKGNYNVKSIVIPNGRSLSGDGMTNTLFNPTNGYNTIILSGDKITLFDFGFQSLSVDPVQNEVYSHCIYTDAVTYNAGFMRPMEGIKINRLSFRNLKGAGIYIDQPIRESHISENRFVGMGTTTISPITSRQEKGSPNNSNNLWIRNNMFYRFASPAIYFKSSTLSTSNLSYSDIYINHNLIHNQLLNEANGIPTSGTVVCAELTHTVVLEECYASDISHNKITAIHPQKIGIYLQNTDTQPARSNIITNNYMSFNGGRTDITYPSTGHYVYSVNPKSAIITENTLYGGNVSTDIRISTTGAMASTTIQLAISENVSEASDITLLLPSLYKGTIEKNGIATYNKINATDTGNASTPSITFGDSNSGFYMAGDHIIGMSINGTANILYYSASVRPFPDNTISLGTSAQRFSVVYAGTGTINTSDDREKTYLEITDVEKQVAKELQANMKKFQFNDAIAEKGKDNARIHFGASAQTVKTIFEKYGLNPFDYALLCYDEWKEQEEIKDEDGNIIQEHRQAGNRYGLRYEELLSFIIGVL